MVIIQQFSNVGPYLPTTNAEAIAELLREEGLNANPLAHASQVPDVDDLALNAWGLSRVIVNVDGWCCVVVQYEGFIVEAHNRFRVALADPHAFEHVAACIRRLRERKDTT